MSGFFLTLIATLLASLGARDTMLVAGLAARQGARPALLIVALASAMLCAGVMGWAASRVLPLLAVDARAVLAAMTLGLGGIEMLVLRPKAAPAEPTQSLGASAIVLLAQQLTDAARFVVFGLGVGLAAPLAAGMGGAMGGAIAILGAWYLGAQLQGQALMRWRRWIGALFLLAAIIIAARNIV